MKERKERDKSCVYLLGNPSQAAPHHNITNKDSRENERRKRWKRNWKGSQ